MISFFRAGSRSWPLALGALTLYLLCTPATLAAQGVTTGSIGGVVTNAQNQPIEGASVIAIHEPSGTSYEATTRADGRYSIPNMRVGGPYTIQVVYAGGGGAAFAPQTRENIMVNLGVNTDVDVNVEGISVAEEVTVSGQIDPVFSSNRTGAATALMRNELESLPTISGRLDSVTRLSPQAGRDNSFAGQDNRLNNITVDGSYFNNSFGLAGSPGERTNVAPISLQAIEQVQISVAPFDVRQGNFVGALVNTVTRSGTNQLRGSLYRQFRSDNMVGTQAKAQTVNFGTFKYGQTGGWVAGPIISNRLFYFVNIEDEKLTQPGTTFIANPGGAPVVGNTTRVQQADLDRISALLSGRFNYQPGPYQGYDHEVPGTRFLIKSDYSLNNTNKVTVRYNHLDSLTDQLVSNSGSLGIGGTRRTSTQALNFQNSNYQIMENIRSGIGEWNSIVGRSMANQLIVGYTHQDESRRSRGELFPFVEILQDGTVYTAFGFEPFTPNNELRYNTFQLQNNFTRFGERHSWTFGATVEKYHSENVFFPGKQSVYSYNTLADFLTDAEGFLANPNRTTSPVTLRRFQVRYLNVPGVDKPVQPLDVLYAGAYAQDDWQIGATLKLIAGIRFDVPVFGETGYLNADADARSFRDENGNAVQYSTAKLPDPKILWSPRVGFNWDTTGEGIMQVRGGTGIFTGKPAYVWISNQIGNTGVLTGFLQADNTQAFPFNPNPDRYKPTAPPTGAPAAAYELALTDPDFKFPQLWRSNIAVDRRLPGGWTGTAEFVYNRDVNGIYYINANLPAAQSTYAGADARPRWVATGATANRLPANQNVSNAIVLKNQNVGTSWNAATSLSRAFSGGLMLKGAYSYGEAKNTVDPGSIAFGSWNANAHAGDPNNPGIGYAQASPGHRVFINGSFSREYFSFGSTTVSVFWEGRTITNASYVFAGDANGDGGTANDLLYVPRNTGEMNFRDFTAGGRTFTAAEQAQAWEAYIEQDSYLSKHRGEYAKRNAVFLPLVRRMDLSIAQDIFKNIGGKRNAFQLRLDILNFGNLLNKNWGVGQRLVGSTLFVPIVAQPLTNPGVDAQGRLQYQLRVVNNELLRNSLEPTADIADVYRMMVTLKYLFN
jgi:hypothetical protein